jgi:hypothetical protein
MAKKKPSLKEYYQQRLEPLWRKAPFVLRITEWKEYPIPVLVIKERHESSDASSEQASEMNTGIFNQSRGVLVERGHLHGDSQRRCLPVIRNIVTSICDDAGVPLELQRYLTVEGMRMRVNLPLDQEAGTKIALICRLQERVKDLDRVELIARRATRFSREEAAYWLSRMTSFSPDAKRWAVAGLRVMLGGHPKDPGVERMLEKLRAR